MFQIIKDLINSTPKAIKFALTLIVSTVLSVNPDFTRAELVISVSNMQQKAVLASEELGSVMANDQWTRVEFSKAYNDPVVMVEKLTDNENGQFQVGIRNIGTMGFEIILNSCNKSRSLTIPLQQIINFSVIENSTSNTTSEIKAIRQRFAWGECA